MPGAHWRSGPAGALGVRPCPRPASGQGAADRRRYSGLEVLGRGTAPLETQWSCNIVLRLRRADVRPDRIRDLTARCGWTNDENQRWPCDYLTEFAFDFGRGMSRRGRWVVFRSPRVSWVGVVVTWIAHGWSSPRLSTSGWGVRLCCGREPMTVRRTPAGCSPSSTGHRGSKPVSLWSASAP